MTKEYLKRTDVISMISDHTTNLDDGKLRASDEKPVPPSDGRFSWEIPFLP